MLIGNGELDMGGADLLEAAGHDVAGEAGLVALAAEVGEVEVFELGGHDLGGGVGGGFVGEMAVAAEDALLQAPGTAAFLEELDVVVGLEHEDVGGANAVENEFGDVAEVGGEGDVAGGGAQEETNGVLSIVRDGKGFDGKIGKIKAVAGIEEAPRDFFSEFAGTIEAFQGGA